MAKDFKSLKDCLLPAYIRSIVTASNLRLGREIVKEHGVEFVELGPEVAIAEVTPLGGVTRDTELRFTENGLKWKCSCTGTRLFCKHCAATAVAAKVKFDKM